VLASLRNKSLVYDSSTCGSHIVDEYFSYISRDDEATNVVNLKRDRQEKRLFDAKESNDMRNNPLIVVPGNPGSGKSTFLIHFPASQAY